MPEAQAPERASRLRGKGHRWETAGKLPASKLPGQKARKERTKVLERFEVWGEGVKAD